MDSTLVSVIALIGVALTFDYINGFHDTANAVATVVSTNVLPGRTAVLLAAVCNFVGAFAAAAVVARSSAPAAIAALVFTAWQRSLLRRHYAAAIASGRTSSWPTSRTRSAPTRCSAWMRRSPAWRPRTRGPRSW